MTPEDDVNKENEDENSEESLKNEPVTEQPNDDDATDANPVDEDAAAQEPVAGSDNGSKDESDDQMDSDIDRAASAQSHAEEAIARAMSGAGIGTVGDDPLGFGDQRMDTDSGAAPVVEVGDELSVLKAQLGESEAKVANQADQLLRLQAEMENQRKRAQNDVTKAHKFALEKFALDLLPVKDSLEMGLLAATGEDAEPIKIIEGSELTLKMLGQALEKYNIVEVNPVDEKFDPEFHQAMSMQPVEGKEPNTVATVMQKGYTLNDRLIRPALVMVAK